MAMTLDQLLNFLSEQVQKNLQLAEKHIHEGRFLFAQTTNLFGAFDCSFQVGLIQWRHGLECPIPSFRTCLMAAQRSSELLADIAEEAESSRTQALEQQRKWDKSWRARIFGKQKRLDPPLIGYPVERKSWWGFPYSTAILLSLLLDGKPDEKLATVNCQPSDWKPSEKDHWDQFLDCGLIHAMVTGEAPNAWEAIVEFGSKSKRLALVTTTYETYVSVITSARQEDWEAANRNVSRLTQLFEHRAHDEYLSGSANYDGGAYNRDSVDFRLATIVKVCYAGRPDQLETLPNLHLWRW